MRVGISCLLMMMPTLAMAQAPVNYRDHVLPVLRKHCLNCHNADKAKSDLNIATYQALMAGGASGEAIKPGSPDQSLLFKAITHAEEPRMPPNAPKIPEADIALIKRWIELGAPETAVGAAKSAARRVDIDPVAVSSSRPTGPPPMPGKLPTVSLPTTTRPHPVTAMAASPWAPLLAVAGHERILLYHTESLELIGALPFPERIPHVLRFSRNGRWLLAAGGRGAFAGKAVIWDIASGKRVTEIGDEADIVLAADISPDHKLVAIGGPGKLVKIFDTATGEMRQQIKKHTDWVTALEFSPDGEFLASGDRNGGAYVWEAKTGGIVFTLGDHRDAITALSWRADSQMLASSSEDGRVILWFAEDGFPTRGFNAHAEGAASNARPGRPDPRVKIPGVLSIQYAANGLMVTCGRDNTARLWRTDGNRIARFDGFSDLPLRGVFSHDAGRVFVGDFTGTIRVWNVKTGKPVGELSTNPK